MKMSYLLGAVCAVLLATGQSQAEPLRGFGNDIPLGFAARQIVPEGIALSFDKTVDTQQRVSWRGGEEWQTVLERVAADRGLAVSYANGSVFVGKSLNSTYSPRAVAQSVATSAGIVVMPYNGPTQAAPFAASSPGTVSVGVAPTAVQAVTPSTSVVAAPRAAIDLSAAPDVRVTSATAWDAKSGETLRTVLASWASSAGWTLVWNSQYEYPLQAGATFRGDFISATSEIVRSLSAARPAVTAAFYRGNKVLVIGNDSSDAVN